MKKNESLDNDATEYTVAAATRVIEQAHETPVRLVGMSQKTFEARRLLAEALEGVGDEMLEFEKLGNDYIKVIRNFRMSAVSEVNQAKVLLCDIRKFLLDPAHDKEIERLAQFVSLCERLQSLKSSGILDAVGDTILKLACHDSR
jgi:hypothetical protein